MIQPQCEAICGNDLCGELQLFLGRSLLSEACLATRIHDHEIPDDPQRPTCSVPSLGLARSYTYSEKDLLRTPRIPTAEGNQQLSGSCEKAGFKILKEIIVFFLEGLVQRGLSMAVETKKTVMGAKGGDSERTERSPACTRRCAGNVGTGDVVQGGRGRPSKGTFRETSSGGVQALQIGEGSRTSQMLLPDELSEELLLVESWRERPASHFSNRSAFPFHWQQYNSFESRN